MNNQSKILASLLVGVAVGATLGILFSSKKGKEILDYLISSEDSEFEARPAISEDYWSDLNDSLGG
jgi:gas vesicle protein